MIFDKNENVLNNAHIREANGIFWSSSLQ